MEKTLMLLRFDFTDERTNGILALIDAGALYPLAYTLEPPVRTTKKGAHNAIPAGEYRLSIRHNTSLAQIFDERWEWHYGMILFEEYRMPWGFTSDWGWTDVEIHPGNYPHETQACPLVGTHVDANGNVLDSREAYRVVYPAIRQIINSRADGLAYIHVVNLDSAAARRLMF